MAIEVRGGQDAKPVLLGQWGGLNTKTDRAALPENDFSWLENYMPIAPGDLRTLYAEGSTLYTTVNPRTVVAMYPYNLGSTSYIALFLDDGSALQINAASGASTTIGAAGTFYAGGSIPACSQYQSLYLIIASDVAANAYWVWDGTALFAAGGLSPQVTVVNGGNNYTSAPTVTAYGGSGTGATFSATVANNQVVAVKCTNAGTGYQLNDQPVLAFSGGGSDTDAVGIPYVAKCSGVSSVAVTTPGKFASQTAAVSIAAPPAGTVATLSYTVVGGVITAVSINAGGSGYWKGPPTVAYPAAGSGALVVLTVDDSGTVNSATLVSGGTGYAGGGLTNMPNPPAGVQATAVATCSPDGTGTFYVAAVTVTNPGFGYTSPPAVTITGGGGVTTPPTGQSNVTRGQITTINILVAGTGFTGNPAVVVSSPNDPAAVTTSTATGVAVISGGAVSSVTITNYGYGYLTASSRLSGGHNGADATCSLMPFGIQATAVETYNNQVWTSANPATGPKMSFSAPNSVSNFGTFSGGGSAPATDSFLRRALIGLRQNSGFLYRFADSSVNAITNVQTSSAGITTYNNTSVDTQMGTAWRDTICAFDRAIVFANSTGVYALFSGSVQKVSDELDALFEAASFNTGVSGVTPTAAVTTIFGVRVYCLLFTTTDPYTNTKRNILACWNGKRWFAASQTKTLTLVALQEIDSVFTAWGTDGTRLFKLFQTPSASLTKVFQTRFEGASEPDATYRADNAYMISKLASGTSSVVFTVDTETGSMPAQTFALVAGRNISQGGVTPNGATYGTLRGFTGTTTALDLQVITLKRSDSMYSVDE